MKNHDEMEGERIRGKSITMKNIHKFYMYKVLF